MWIFDRQRGRREDASCGCRQRRHLQHDLGSRLTTALNHGHGGSAHADIVKNQIRVNQRAHAVNARRIAINRDDCQACPPRLPRRSDAGQTQTPTELLRHPR